MAEQRSSRGVHLAGLALAGAGAAHFVAPQLFEPVTRPLFPRDTDRHIKTNGGIETALGLGLLAPKTRKLAAVGALGYLAYLGANAIRNR